MTLNERIQHLLIVVSFLTLAISGFPLAFPGAGWAKLIVAALGGPAGRAKVHRVAAAVMIAVVIYHILGIVISGIRHRRTLRERGISSIPVMFTRKDLADLRQNLAYFVHAVDEPPKYGKYSYIEKMEYWALLWGVVVMTLSGLILWFPFKALMSLPRWVVPVSLVVHGYEAALAVLSIVVWHWYHVHFAPGHFPMNWVWITGKISEEEMKEHHPLEYERLVREPADAASREESQPVK